MSVKTNPDRFALRRVHLSPLAADRTYKIGLARPQLLRRLMSFDDGGSGVIQATGDSILDHTMASVLRPRKRNSR